MFTRLERKNIYFKALLLLIDKECRYGCEAIAKSAGIENYNKQFFPEWEEFNPNNGSLMWWESNDYDSRIKAMVKTYKLT